MLAVAHNLSSMNAQRQFNINVRSKAKSTEKLSSGYRINRAADDAAGLAISEKMRRQIRGLTQGVANTLDGVSYCQVADGALVEVNSMLNRLTELSVQAANDTNTKEDREYIQEEVNEILSEIDRIGDTTSFNERLIFKGEDRIIYNPDGTPFLPNQLPVSSLSLVDVNLGKYPLTGNPGTLQLGAMVTNVDSPAYMQSYNLVYGNGSTSNSTIRIKYVDEGGNDASRVINLNSMQVSNYLNNPLTGESSQTLSYDADGITFSIEQKVTLSNIGDDEKDYNFTYKLNNTSDKNLSVEFMFHVDTAYNNNDRCESYFINGNKIGATSVYTNNPAYIDDSTSTNIYNGIPSSFSIVDTDNTLAFSEKVSIDTMPTALSIGQYNQICNWDYYENTFPSNLGVNTNRMDLGFGLIYKYDMSSGDSQDVKFKYGIVSVESDTNLDNVPIKSDKNPLKQHFGEDKLWIQSGSEAGQGLWLKVGEMNANILGIRDLDVTSSEGARNSITRVKDALHHVMKIRSTVGAEQNRLEHIINNENNIIENTTAAESRIRDTDMAKEMVALSTKNILEQAGISMMSQANQSNQGVLSLIQ